jgi:peptidoglycan-associated lipoprotein
VNKRVAQFIAIGFSSLALISCAGTPANEDVDSNLAEFEDRSREVPYAGGIEETKPVVSPLDDPSSPLANRVIYFDLDRSDIRPEYRETIEAHAGYLANPENANVQVELAGHCDERGTREYNLALGERRANAVSRLMSTLGVSNNQLQTNSYGEEQPVAAGHNESAWRQNRRVEIEYLNR